MPSIPKLLGPECVGIGYNDVQNFAVTMTGNSFYGLTYHLYHGSTPDGAPDGYTGNLRTLTNIFPTKPHFMTEYGYPGMMDTACIIHNCLAVGQDVGFNYWSLVWPVGGDGLVQIENPYNLSSWTNAPPGTKTQSRGWWLTPSYWAMKHFSYFIQPGYQRVSASDDDSNVRSSAYVSPDGLRLVLVLINTNASVSSMMNFSFGAFSFGKSSVYQTVGTNTYAGTNTFLSLGSLTNGEVLPPQSLTTVVLDQTVNVGTAANPLPSNGASAVAINSTVNWLPGSNALTHALYLGINSNSVFQATTTSPEFRGVLTNNSFSPALSGSSTYFWRVDEIAGANANTGPIWSFSTVTAPSLGHRYSFSETSGTSVADSVGGTAWNGSLPNGGTFSSGQLTLASGSQQYVSLPAGIVSTLSDFTIEAWVKLNSTANWNRIFDFGNNATTYMFLTPQNGSTSKVRFAITTSGGGGEQQISGLSALSAGVWYHVAVTLNGTTGILYVNGVAVGTNNAMTLKPSSLGSTVNNYVGRSQYSADPYLNGLIDEFRIYNVALSASEIAGTDALGPNQLLSTASPPISMSAMAGNLVLTWPLASAGFALQSCTNLGLGDWVNVTSPTPQIIGGQWQVTLPAPSSADSTFYRLAK
jgi:hypothetical protein